MYIAGQDFHPKFWKIDYNCERNGENCISHESWCIIGEQVMVVKGLCIWNGGKDVCQEVLLQTSNLDVCDGDGDDSYGDDIDDASISRRGGLLCQELFLQTSDARPLFFADPVHS